MNSMDNSKAFESSARGQTTSSPAIHQLFIGPAVPVPVFDPAAHTNPSTLALHDRAMQQLQLGGHMAINFLIHCDQTRTIAYADADSTRSCSPLFRVFFCLGGVNGKSKLKAFAVAFPGARPDGRQWTVDVRCASVQGEEGVDPTHKCETAALGHALHMALDQCRAQAQRPVRLNFLAQSIVRVWTGSREALRAVMDGTMKEQGWEMPEERTLFAEEVAHAVAAMHGLIELGVRVELCWCPSPSGVRGMDIVRLCAVRATWSGVACLDELAVSPELADVSVYAR